MATTTDTRRSDQLGPCPACGRPVAAAESVRAWPGKYAHSGCATYVPRRRRRDGSHSRSRAGGPVRA